MRYILSGHLPPFTRVLLIESGSRGILDVLIPRLFEHWGEDMELDLVTCYSGEPAGFRGRVYRVQNYTTPETRRELYAELAGRGYNVTGVLCSNEAIMTKWKWMLAAQVPAKIMVINENADFLWLDTAHARHIARMVRIRLGLTGSVFTPSLLRLLLFPFSLMYLLVFAAVVHTRRKV